MNPLFRRLAVLRLRVRLLDGWQGICAVLALVVGVGFAVGILDYWAHLPSLLRAGGLVALLVGGGLVAYRKIYQPFARSCDDLSLALRVEEEYPELNDALASTVQFLRQSAEEQSRGDSVAMRQQTIQQALARAADCDFARIIDRKGAMVYGALAIAILAVTGTVIAMNRQYAGIAFMRLVEPFGPHTWTRVAVSRNHQAEDKRWEAISPDIEDKIAIGRPYAIKVDLTGKIPSQATIEVVSESQIRSDKTVALKPGETSFVMPIDMTQHYQQFKFRVLANDGAFPPRAGAWHSVKVLPPPSLIDLDGQPSPQIALHPPAYADLPTVTSLAPGTRHIELYAGTNVVLRGKADRPLEEAWVEYRPENALVMPASVLSFLGQTHPLQALAQAASGQAVWGHFPATFDNDRSVFQITFMPWVAGGYILHLRDHDQLERHEASDLRVQIDPLPDVKLVLPGSSVTRVPDAQLAFKFRITDEIFAIRSVFVEYHTRRADGTRVRDPKRTVLYEAKDFGKLLPFLLARVGLMPWLAPDLRLRNKEMDFETVWSLKDEKFKEGELVFVEVCADDFCDIYLQREPGRSHTIEVRIVSKSQITKEAEARLQEIQQDIVRLEKMQEDAIDKVKTVEKKDKIDQSVRDILAEAEGTQREIQERIGRNPDQTMRRELRELRQTLKENGLDGSQVNQELSKIQGTVDRLAAQELPQIEPKLAEARNDLSQSDKNTPKMQKNLAETKKLQEKVRTALNELNKELAPYQSTFEMRVKLREIMEEQKKLQEELDKLRELQHAAELEKDDLVKKTVEEGLKQQIERQEKEQRDLAEKLSNVIRDMKAAKEVRDRAGETENAKKIDSAVKQLVPEPKEVNKDPKKDGKKPPDDKKDEPKADVKKEEVKEPTTRKMKNVAQQLREKHEATQKAIDEQKEVIKEIDQALRALEGRDQDFTKNELQKREEAEKKLNELARDLKQLRDDTKDLDKIKDEAERLKRKEELAQKHDQLQAEMEKAARALARLQEQRAANNLDDAAKDIEKSKQQMQQGENAQKNQNDAKEKLDQARQEMKQREEELARELMIQYADKLTALKERQDAAIKRSEDFHPKVMKRKSWTTGLLGTIEGNVDAQKGIADETDSLRDKIKEAKVFEAILKKAKDSMDEAARVMSIRGDSGKDRRYVEKDGGEMMDEDELKDENEWQSNTLKQQKDAAKRLDRILDAIKQELAKKPKDNNAEAKEPKKDDKEPQNARRNADGIPQTAQLKALKAEQLDLNERTEDFANRNPDTNKLDDAQRRELHELEVEQERLQELFQQILPPQVEQKEGDQK